MGRSAAGDKSATARGVALNAGVSALRNPGSTASREKRLRADMSKSPRRAPESAQRHGGKADSRPDVGHGIRGDVFMRSTVAKRSIVIAGHKTSIRLADEFWNRLKAIE